MSNTTNNKIKQLRDKILSFEYPYDASVWDQLEAKLNTASSGYNFSVAVLSSAALMVGLIALSFALNSTRKAENTMETAVLPVESVDPEMNRLSENNQKKSADVIPETTTVYSVDNNLDRREVVRPMDHYERNIESRELETKEQLDELEIKESGSNEKLDTKTSDHQTTVPQITPSRNSICSGSKLDIEISGKITGCQILVDGNYYEAMEKMSIVFAHSGEQKIELFDKEGKLLNDRAIMVYAAPEPEIETEQTIEFGGRPVLEFSSSFVRGNKYAWFINDEYHSDNTEGYRLLRQRGALSIRLEIVNKFGCSNYSTEYIHADRDYNLLAPNSFSPNGDGRNETWMPAGLDLVDGSFVLEVFDRNQQLVYRTSSFSEPWNGDINGSPAPSGDFYMWQAVVLTEKFGKQVYRGRILVL